MRIKMNLKCTEIAKCIFGETYLELTCKPAVCGRVWRCAGYDLGMG